MSIRAHFMQELDGSRVCRIYVTGRLYDLYTVREEDFKCHAVVGFIHMHIENSMRYVGRKELREPVMAYCNAHNIAVTAAYDLEP